MAVPSSKPFIIRPFQPQDQEGVLRLWANGFRESFVEWSEMKRRTRMPGLAWAIGTVALLCAGGVIPARLGVAAAAALAAAWGASAPLQVSSEMRKLLQNPGDMGDIAASWSSKVWKAFYVAVAEDGAIVGCGGLVLGPDRDEQKKREEEQQQQQGDQAGSGTAAKKWGEESEEESPLLRLPLPHEATVLRMSVDGGRRRGGVGTAVLAALEEHARQHGMTVLRLITAATPAVAFYQRNGFKIVYEKTTPVYVVRVMEKALAASGGAPNGDGSPPPLIQ